ncbi:MAG: hypothetical protein R3Y60_00225 [bacterium]
MLSVIWLFIIIFSMLYGLITNVVGVNEVILNVSYNSLDTFFSIACGLVLWSGILEVAKQTGFLKFCTKKINVITKRIFETSDEETLSLISANFICNFIGLTTMATPFGLEAVSKLKKENSKYDIDLVLVGNFIGMSLIPISMLTLRNSFNSVFTVQLIPYVILIALCNTIIGFVLVRVCRCFT